MIALESTLDNGDTVEIFTSKTHDAGPSRDWLKFVQSPRARNKIRQWFSKERREAAVDAGKDQIAKAMRKQGLPLQRLTSVESLTGAAEELRFADEFPRTASGKVQKYVLREKEWRGQSKRIH